MWSRTGESHSFHDSITQPAIACLVTVRPQVALRSPDIRYSGIPMQYLRSMM